jgi:hypothetical protein
MPSPNGMKAERRITLLQLRDGSMYGLTDYWVRDGNCITQPRMEAKTLCPASALILRRRCS